MAFGPMDPVTARSSLVYWLMVSRSYRPKTILTLSPMTRPRYGRRSPAPPALSSSLAIRMAALVYICAFAPEEGATTLVDQNKYPPTPIFQHVEVVDGRIWLRPTGVPEFAGDLPEAEQQLVWSTQMAPLADLFDQPVPGAAWQH